MDYEKAYKGALARCKWLLANRRISRIAATDLFRELGESEDDKIKREILDFFYQFEDKELRGIDISPWIAWVEKQEVNPFSGVGFDFDGHHYGMCARDGGAEVLVDGKIVYSTTNPVKPCDDLEKAAERYASCVDMGTCGELIFPAFMAGADWQKKQDQETIELAEDHAMLAGRMQMKEEMQKIMESDPDAIEKTPKQDYSGLNDFERAIHRGFLCAGVENVPVSIIKQTAEEALKRTPAEWSEEDEKIRSVLIAELKRIAANTRTNTTSINYSFAKEIDWLKSLRPQPHWKPSDIDIKYLDLAIVMAEADKSYNLADGLKRLRDELKKL